MYLLFPFCLKWRSKKAESRKDKEEIFPGFDLWSVYKILKDVGLNGMPVQFNDGLTGEHSGEEDVVREGDKATFSQCVKYAVLIGKLLPLLGDLLLIQARTQKKSYIKIISCDSAKAS